MIASAIALLLVAVAVGLDNFGVATAIGMSGVDRGLRVRLAGIFGLFEAAMPVAGLVLGHAVARQLGSSTNVVAGTLLAVMGAYGVAVELLGRREPKSKTFGFWPLVFIGAALSVDNLVIGFALGTARVNLVLAVAVIAAVSVALSLFGLELGRRIGTRIGERGALLGGATLIFVGAAVATGIL
jgi:manganese efflux pump family protein